MKRLLLLIPSTTYRARDFVNSAVKLDIELIVGSEKKQTLEELTGKTATFDFDNLDRGTRQILDLYKKWPFDAIVPVDERALPLAAWACEKLNLPYNSPESIDRVKDKELFRRTLKKGGLLTPSFQLIPLDQDPKEVALRDYPCVLKPLHMSASRGVIRADDPESFTRAFERVKSIIKGEKMGSQKARNHLLVESYIPGREVALEGMVTGGNLQVLALFDKPDPLCGPFFEETRYIAPASLSEREREELEEVTERALTELGIRTGPIHGEYRLNQRGVWVLEIAARSIGGLCSRMLRFGTGMSLEELILRQALDLEIPSYRREDQATGVLMIPIPHRGILKGYRGQEILAARKGIEEVEITIPRGEEVIPLPEASRYLGFVFARGESPKEVKDLLGEAQSILDFHIETPWGSKKTTGEMI